jgi:hypothetical protein
MIFLALNTSNIFLFGVRIVSGHLLRILIQMMLITSPVDLMKSNVPGKKMIPGSDKTLSHS